MFLQSISVAFERFRSASDLRMRFRNHIHILVTVHVAREAIMEYWGMHNYCVSLPPPMLVLPLLLTFG